MLAYTGESLDDIVADGMEESWKVARENWFAKTGEDDEAIRSQKTPGKFYFLS